MFVTSIFPNPVQPTLGTFHGQLSRELGQTCDLDVVTPQPWFPATPEWGPLKRWQKFSRIPRQYVVEGVPAHSPKYFMVPAVSEAVRPWLIYPELVKVASRLHAHKPVDVINGLWLYPDGVAAAKVAARLEIPLVLTGLGCDVNVYLEEPAKRPQILAAARQARSIIVVSRPLKDCLVAAGVPDQKVTVIANGVDTSSFIIRDRSDCATRLSLPRDGRRIVYVGRLAEEKGITTLIAAMSLLRARRLDVRLYVIGDGPQRPLVERMIAEHALADHVALVGARDHHEVPLWIGAGDVLCLPSLREGCPNVVLEALAAGRPVVASDVGGVPDLVDASNGRLVPPEQPEVLAAALDEAVSIDWDPAAVRRTVERRSWKETACEYERVFRSSCGADETPRR
jgi:glycosyltransferase involved in cell wall biosynthesis